MDMSLLFDEIASIEEVEVNSNRYDLTVEDNHNFFANNVLVHNCQNIMQEVFEDNKDTQYEVSVKLDGSSCTAYHRMGEVGVCSRNIEFKVDAVENEGNSFVSVCKKTGLLDALKKIGRNIAVQGELMGPGIQGNREAFKEHKLFVFDMYDIDTGKYLAPAARDELFNEINELCGGKINHVPVFKKVWSLADLGESVNIESLLLFAEGESLVNKVREGLVFKSLNGDFSFKAISNKYLLENKDA